MMPTQSLLILTLGKRALGVGEGPQGRAEHWDARHTSAPQPQLPVAVTESQGGLADPSL